MSAIQDLQHMFLMRIINIFFNYTPQYDSYRIKDEWLYFGGEQLRELEKNL